jgi:hypothetical protein
MASALLIPFRSFHASHLAFSVRLSENMPGRSRYTRKRYLSCTDNADVTPLLISPSVACLYRLYNCSNSRSVGLDLSCFISAAALSNASAILQGDTCAVTTSLIQCFFNVRYESIIKISFDPGFMNFTDMLI